ncbi:MAG TPA: dihydropteroate synthase [Candidatus Limnocylindrales bacterium]|nr:dihydropteroate synthase [Candidatus Limnocylindrales bacterium]
MTGAADETRIGSTTFRWGERTYVMGIVNVTPDSFSGDGLLAGGERTSAAAPAAGRIVARAVDQAREMVEQGADVLDVGGESSRPGHADVDAAEERRRVVPVIAGIRNALPDAPISIDTTKAEVAEAALDAGADAVNDVWGVAAEPALLALVAERGVPIVLMHNRATARYADVAAEVVADLERAIEQALEAGVAWSQLIVDPGIGFGKTADQNLALLADLATLRALRRPILLGTSRKSTIGHVLDLPPQERVEGTIATTVLGIAAGVDVVRVHDVRANVRAARMADAIVRRPHSSTTQEASR